MCPISQFLTILWYPSSCCPILNVNQRKSIITIVPLIMAVTNGQQRELQRSNHQNPWERYKSSWWSKMHPNHFSAEQTFNTIHILHKHYLTGPWLVKSCVCKCSTIRCSFKCHALDYNRSLISPFFIWHNLQPIIIQAGYFSSIISSLIAFREQ